MFSYISSFFYTPETETELTTPDIISTTEVVVENNNPIISELVNQENQIALSLNQTPIISNCENIQSLENQTPIILNCENVLNHSYASIIESQPNFYSNLNPLYVSSNSVNYDNESLISPKPELSIKIPLTEYQPNYQLDVNPPPYEWSTPSEPAINRILEKQQKIANIKIKKLAFKRLTMEAIANNSSILIIGQRMSGKSTIIHDFFQSHPELTTGCIFSPYDSYKSPNDDNQLSTCVVNDYSSSLLTDKITNLVDINHSDSNQSTFMIFEDCYDLSWKDPSVKKLLNQSQSYATNLLITRQHSGQIPPNVRSQMDWVLIGKTNLVNERKLLYTHYGQMFPTFDMFSQALKSCTQNHGFMAIYQGSHSENLEERVFWYRADVTDVNNQSVYISL